MSAENGSDSDDGRRDARYPWLALSPCEKRLGQAAAWFNLATLANDACKACEISALKNAQRCAQESLREIEERLASSTALHGENPEHAKAPLVLVIDSEDADFVPGMVHTKH